MGIRQRQLIELSVPGAAIGVIAALVVGLLAALVGQPVGWAAIGALALGIPMAVFGAGYAMLVGSGAVRPGVFAPAALYWLIAFPLARLLHETFTPVLLGGGPTPPADLLGFLAYQALVSMGFAFGYVWLLERLIPHWLDRIRGHNPDAQRLYERYTSYAEVVYQAREQRRARRTATNGARTRGGRKAMR